ncbi:hybrid sensor histidine kinase/response regulator [Bacillus sp. FJAT-42315]|uniref:hybrid sensor histidine kinase/response regulator n=1 Tax=Bacillus sp. FJAT-42315 TaxID=2014077 RepID=UPI000C23E164|nr:ATP-binding protein [Bacillus sp. FJAT-42315]
MKKNITIIVAIIMLFLSVFLFENWGYFESGTRKIVKDGELTLTEADLQGNSVWQLDGEWSFYPNELLSPTQSLEPYEENRLVIPVPKTWDDYVEPNAEGVSVGTYHLKIHVSRDGEYGFYIKTIRQANRVFINGEEVGGIGNPSQSAATFEKENDDKYVVFGKSENQVIDLMVHVGNQSYPKAGILYPIQFGEKDGIQKGYLWRMLVDIVGIVGYIVFGLIYLISYWQNRKRKEELFFGLFALSFGFHLSLINQKWFFVLNSDIDMNVQVSMQLGTALLALASMTLFVYYMFPQLVNQRMIVGVIILLAVSFLVYSVYSFFSAPVDLKSEELFFRQNIYILVLILVVFYNVFVLMKAVFLDLEGIKYLLIVLASLFCYAVLVSLNFLFGVPIDHIALLLFSLVLLGFSSLLSYRTNVSYEKAQKLSAELTAYNRMKDEFLLKTSHELRTPLNGILNVSKALMEGMQGPLKRAQQENVMLIHNVTKRLEHLVEDLLFSSNYMTGEVRVSMQVVPVTVMNEVIEEVKVFVQNLNNIQLICNIDEVLPPMYTDELRFKQVLYNLVYNAFRYTEQGEISVRAEVQDEMLKIQVSDTGIGIPSRDLEHVFNAFYQVNPHNEKGGLGLGLSITKNIVEALNGQIKVSSQLGKGTTFTFTIPLATEAMIEIAAAQVSATNETEILKLELPIEHFVDGKTILVVDDDHLNIKVLVDALIQEGYSIIAVDNGFDAINYLNTMKVDLMLVDLMMEEMSGYDLCRQVREDYDMLELPIIILTAVVKHTDLVLSLEVGANDYLQKPIDMDELLIRIRSYLAVRQSSVEAIENEMNFLYAQVTPHFVYNTLNTIIGLSYTNIDQTREALYCLSTYFRAKLNVHYRHTSVSLEEELELVQAYLYIEQMRFGDRLAVKYDIDETIDVRIPALTIQPLVENAVFHGISKKQEGGTIELSVQRDGDFVCIKIQDDGVGIPEAEQQRLMNKQNPRIGFSNPFKKIKLMKNASFQLLSKEGEGTTIMISLPERRLR